MNFRLLVVAAILLLVIFPVYAADITSVGTHETAQATVDVKEDGVDFSNTIFVVSSKVKVDGVLLETVPLEKTDFISMVVGEIEEMANMESSEPEPILFRYELTGNRMKETITLTEPADVRFPLTIPADKKLVAWSNGQYKILSRADVDDTMSGIIIEKPFGIDANGAYVAMNYTVDVDNELHLIYSDKIPVWDVDTHTMSYTDIAYPLVIDPTWVAVSGRYEIASGNDRWVLFNTTGNNTYTPNGSLNIRYIAIGGGGGGGVLQGGGGGAGGVALGSTAISGTETISIGAGGSQNSNGNNTFLSTDGGTIVAIGGGSGGSYSLFTGRTGGSGGGGGGQANTAAGSNVTSPGSQGMIGGVGVVASDYGGGGGGGFGHAGYAANTAVGGGNGGVGIDASFFNVGVVACGGGGATNTLVAGAGGCYGAGNGTKNAVGAGWSANQSTGNGGGGAFSVAGGTGGSGLVVLYYNTTIIPSFNASQVSIPINWTTTGFSGVTPFTVFFNSTGIGLDTNSYNFTANGVSFNISSVPKVQKTFTVAGNYSIRLNVTSSITGTSNETAANRFWANITANPYAPNASFVATPTEGAPALQVFFTDTTTNNTGCTYNWSFGDEFGTMPYSDTVGDTSHVYTYGGVFFANLTVSGVNGTSYYEEQITVSNSQPKINSLYLHETRFIISDLNGNPLPSVPISMTMMNSSVDSTNWFSSLFGIPSTATPIEGTTVNGFTDSAGGVIFTVAGSGLYQISGVDATRGINFVKLIHPDQNVYTIYVTTSATAAIDDMNNHINSSLFATTIGSDIYLNMSYVDNQSQTTGVIYMVQAPNRTVLYTTTLTPVAGSTAFGYNVANIAGAGYVWSSSAYNTQYGWINNSQGITTKGVTGVIFDPTRYKDRW